MGLRFVKRFAQLRFAWGVAILVSGATFAASHEANALTGAYPSAITAVTPDVVARMRMPLRDQILELAEKFGQRTDVPYVWGGDAIGDPSTCEACRACVETKKKTKLKNRLKVCAPCRQCGIDCSHFASRFFREAGLELPFASTETLRRMSKAELREKMGLVDIGSNLADARPGDLILHRRHLTILLRLTSPSRGDVLHSSRSNKKGRMGGIEIARDKNLLRFRGKIVRILRRAELLEEDQSTNHLASQLRSE